ncbi:membrane protein [Gemmatimonadetes bacterium T265]|nr:membrane protein [Gemmatimonadetes bacterium T265]
MPPPAQAPLRRLWRGHRRALGLTYALTGVENGCEVFYPLATGHAIDGLLAGRPARLALLGALWAFHLAVGLGRHLYDTRVFTAVYAELAADMVARQRAAGVAPEQVVARVALSRELVDFFESEVPAVGSAAVRFAGAVGMLFTYDARIGAYALATLAPALAVTRWFARRVARLHRALNDQLERQGAVVTARPPAAVARHFARLARWRVQISNAEALTWGVVELAAIGLTLAALLRLTVGGRAAAAGGTAGVTAGTIYAVLSYVYSFYDGVISLPATVQRVVRVRDIGVRVADAGR